MSNALDDLIKRYSVVVSWSDEDGGYIATVPDLPGCSAFGIDRSEAVSEITDAINAWIGAAIKAGNPVIMPSEKA